MREGVLQLDAGILDFLFRSKDLILTLIAEVSADHVEKTTISAMMSELEGFLQGTPRTEPVIETRTEPPVEQISELDSAKEIQAPIEPEEDIETAIAAETEEDSEAEGVEFFEEPSDEAVSPYEAALDEPEGEKTVAEHQLLDSEMDVLPETIEDRHEMAGQEETTKKIDVPAESSEPRHTLEDTIPLLLNVSLYLDDLQDGLRPGDVIESLLQTVSNLLHSMGVMGFPEAVDILESFERQISAIEEDRESLSRDEIDSLRTSLYNLRSVYPDDLFLPLKKALERAEEAAHEQQPVSSKPSAFVLSYNISQAFPRRLRPE